MALNRTADSPRPSWKSASELSRRIARVAVVLVDAIHANEQPDTQPFGVDLFNDELEAWQELEKLVAEFKGASGD